MMIAFRRNFTSLTIQFINWIKKDGLGQQFACFVLFPSLILAMFFLFISPDRYVSQASIMVKEAGVAQPASGFLESLGFDDGGSSSDEQLLQSFLSSPNLLESLETNLKLKAHYSQSNDFIFGLSINDSFEDFLKFYRRHVTISIDPSTGLLNINVEAYTPYFSQSLANALIAESENFINDSGRTIARLEMEFALDEISTTQARLKKAKQELIHFQNKHRLVSPESDGESLFTIIYSLEGELAKTEAEIHQAQIYLNERSPKMSLLTGKSDALKKQINLQKLRLTGQENGDDKLNELNAQYQSLILDLELATSLYKSSLSAYEVSRVQASKQLKYLVVSSKPHLAEEALYPERFYWFVTWLLFMFVIWGIYRLVLAFIKEHKD